MKLRQFSRLSIGACALGLVAIALCGLYLVATFRDHMAEFERLDRLQFAVAELGVHLGELERGSAGVDALYSLRANMATMEDVFSHVEHPEVDDVRELLAEFEIELAAALTGAGSGAAPGELADPEFTKQVQRWSRLRELEAELTLAESQILHDEHKRNEYLLITAVGGSAGLTVAFGLLCIVGFAILDRRIRGPVQSLIEAASEAERGNLAHRVQQDCRDEFGRLTAAFNAMMAQLQRREVELAAYQDSLQRSLAERSTVLDALPAHIALLDADGTIRDVNERWRHFGRDNNNADPTFGLGSNYLALCDRADGDCGSEARQVAVGLRAVLAGEQPEFSMEYPCHSPEQKRWFRVMATGIRLPNRAEGEREFTRGAVVTHVDITERRLAEDDVREQAYLLRMAGRMAGFGGWSVDLSDGSVSWSEQTAAIHDLPPGTKITLEQGLAFYTPDSRPRIEACWQACVDRGVPWDEELEIITAKRRRIWVRTIGEPVRDDSGTISQIRGAFQEITEYKRLEQELRRAAYRDELTGLSSRQGFSECLSTVAEAAANEQSGHLVVLDLQGLNDINQAFGYEVGSKLLIAVGQRLADAVSPTGCVGRLGGDQFGVLEPDGMIVTTLPESIAAWIESLFDAPFEIGGDALQIDATFGIAAFGEGDSTAEIMRRARVAFHAAREHEEGAWLAYDATLDETATQRVHITQDLRNAVADEEFELHYQPKVRLSDGRVMSAEGLLRWHHPSRGLQPPDRFIPAAEHSKMIVPIGAWVIREACQQLRAWQANDLAAARVAVNVSMVQLIESDLASTVQRIIAETGVKPNGLSLEITESVLEREPAGVWRQLTRLHELGVHLALDDFGTGYASLSHLYRYPFDEIKIDRSFVALANTQAYSREIVNMVVRIARVLECDVVAEGIETPAQRDLLLELGCHTGQGYYYSMPLQTDDLHWLLTHHSPLPLAASYGSTGDSD